MFLHRERYGAIVMHLDDGNSGRVGGDVSLTRLGVDGGMHVFDRKFSGARDGDLLRLRDANGEGFTVTLTTDGARMVAPDGSVVMLSRSDLAGENTLLASLAGEAAAMRRTYAGL